MTTFSYTTGNPSNLVAGGAASMNDIQGPFTDITTYINGGNIDASNLATSAKPVTILGQYRTVAEAAAAFIAGATSGVKVITSSGALTPSGTAVGVPFLLVPFLAADHAVSGLTAKLRLRAAMSTNATSPAITFTFGLYPVSSSAGGATSHSITVGTVVSGSTVALAPGASTTTAGVSSDITLPSDGVYVLGVNQSGTVAASSFGTAYARLEVHHV